MALRPKFAIFDGNALLHRAFHALPPLTTKSGMLVNAVYGFVTIFIKVLKEIKPEYAAVTFDRREPTFRHETFKEYKAQRVKQPQELYDQIPLIKEIIAAFRVPIFELAGFEADDVIGTLAEKVGHQTPSVETMIVTGDLDTLQLVSEHTKVYTLKRGLGDTIIYDQAAVEARYGLEPDQLIDFKALRGDPSDNIPGVRGIGEKTALELIKTFGSIEAMYIARKHHDARFKNFSAKILELVDTSKAEAELSKKLVTIVRDVKIDFNLADCQLRDFDISKLVDIFQKLEFKSLLARIPELQNKLDLAPVALSASNKKLIKVNSGNYYLVETVKDLEKLLTKLHSKKIFAFDTETTSLNPWLSKLVGISLAWQTGEAYFISTCDTILKSKPWLDLVKILSDKKVAKVGHNLKYDVEALQQAGIVCENISFDTLVAAYLLRSGDRTIDLKSLAFQEFGVAMQHIEELIGKAGKNQLTIDQVPLEQVKNYACADADFTWRLKEKLESELGPMGLLKLFHDIEMPLVPVLVQIEAAGIKVNIKYLKTIGKEVKTELDSLEKKIHKLAGREFNINSPKQLKEILFDELKVSTEGLRHTKTGVSTAASELEKMRGLHPIIEHLFDWRELSKLLSTYVEAIPELVNQNTGRVHTSFNQTVTATGRLSSSDPNLQNIPIRGDWGKRLRQAFVAESGNKLVSADYSQIELRIVAHLAQDKKMIDIFKQGKDIHTTTAAFILGVDLAKVTPEERRSAKEVNFGVLYGMGAWGLAERTGISRDEARNFIERYFNTFKGVAEWIEKTKQAARDDGYVSTFFGRRRYLPEINSGVAQVRAQAERMAVNLPTQGTAADLMKVAMINVSRKLKESFPEVKMILQVHDELVFEVPANQVSEVARLVKQEMERAVELSVPIVVDVKVGDNWGEMEKLDINS